MDCIFCKIANKEMGTLIYEDEKCVAFNDLNPQAPVHILIVPKKHLSTLNELDENNKDIIGHLAYTASRIAKEKGLEESGYRIIMNCNGDAGQTVFHIHMHLLGGKKMKEGLA